MKRLEVNEDVPAREGPVGKGESPLWYQDHSGETSRGRALARLRDAAASANASNESRTRTERKAMDHEERAG